MTGFLEDYNQNRSNGAWLSGFFGSGKSHLLKMMAVVLENRTVNGHSALDLFRPKCAANPMLKGLLERAVSTPSRSILFNIDQKADVINKNETDAVLSVFLKVLFDFSDGSKRYATYADEEAFITTYPFVPYQFDLFQTTMLNLSTHDAFTDRYTAIAERSMLAVCQEANRLLGIRIEEALRHQLGEATVLVSGEEVEIASADGRGRLTEGFDRLAARVYSFRKMVEGMAACGEGDIPKFLNNDPQLPLGETESEPENEMLTVLRQNQALGQRTTLRMLADKFEGVPYGWRLAIIECLVARLWATGKVMLVSGGNEIDKGNVRAALTNTRGYDSLVVQLQRMVAQSEIRALKGFAQDFFSEPVPVTDAKGVAVFVKKRMSDFVQELETLSRQSPYPFVGALDPAKTLLKTAASKSDDWIFSPEFKTQAEELLDAKDDFIDPILKILRGPQKAMFDAACRLLTALGSAIRAELEKGNRVLV